MGAGGPSGGSPGWPGLLGSEWCCPGSGRLAEGLPGATVFIPTVDQAPVVAAQSRERAQIRDSGSPPRERHLGVGCGSGGTWAQVSCVSAAGPQRVCQVQDVPCLGPHSLFSSLLSGLANHGQTRHMVRGRAPVLHTRTHVCSHSSRGPSGEAPPALPGTAREHLGGPVGPEEGQAAGLHGPRRAPSPPGVAKPPCSPLGPPPRAFWVPTWRPRADPWRLPTAGTKPEPAAQWEGVPHQGAADPGGLPAPRQAAADELDRRPR